MRQMAFINFCLFLAAVQGFTVHQQHQQLQHAKRGVVVVVANSESSTTDDYDKWFEDFDPSTFDDEPVHQRKSYGGGRGGGGGGDSGVHDYQRDFEADNSNVDLDAVNRLIADRLQARKTGNFEVADDIRDMLLQDHGVSILDRERLWRSGCSKSGSGRNWGKQQQQNGRNDRGGTRKPRDFGPTGHDYNLSREAGPNTSSLSDDEIHERIAERLRFKMVRNFREADAIQQEFESLGIFVHDGRKEWRADGERFGDYQTNDRGPGRTDGSRSDRFRPYEQSKHSEPTEFLDVIKDLIEERAEAKKARAFNIADEIQDELREEYNVQISDKLREWSVGGDFGMGVRGDLAPYAMAEASEAPEDAATIQALVEDREKARKRRDFDTADEIRDELRDTYNVEVQDRLRLWSVGGNFHQSRGDRPARGNAPLPDFVRRGGGDLTDENVATIQGKLAERDEAKRDKQFGKADRIRDDLREEFKIRVDDNSREWMVVTEAYVMAPVVPLPDDTRTYIEQRIGERAVAKLKKEYDLADEIRDELYDTYQVFLDDRVREWRIEGSLPETMDESVLADDDETLLADEGIALEPNMDSATDSALHDEETPELKSLDMNHDDEEETQNNVSDEGIALEPNMDSATDSAQHDEETPELKSLEMDHDDEEETQNNVSEDLESLKVDELKERLREAGLPVSGRKAELIERLLAS